MDEQSFNTRIAAAVEQIDAETARRPHPTAQSIRRRRARRTAWRSGVVAVGVVAALVGALRLWESASPTIEFEPADQPASSSFDWTTIAPSPARNGVAVDGVWSGTDLLVWTAEPSTPESAGSEPPRSGLLAYSVTDRRWETLAEPPLAPAPNGNDSVALWTGSALVIYGQRPSGEAALAQYDPARNTWTVLPPAPQLDNVVATPVWTGRQLLLWGGVDHAGPDVPAVGAVYDTSTQRWSVMADAPIAPRQWHSAVWTGEEMIIWGGTDLVGADFGDGAAYNPRTDHWRLLPEAPIAGRVRHDAVWTGTEMIIVGGHAGPSTPATAAAYSPSTDTWRRLTDVPVDARYDTEAVWTGTDVVFWGGYDYYGNAGTLGDGAAYDPSRNEWTVVPPAPLTARCSPQLAATAHGVIVYGGITDCDGTRTKAAYDGAILSPSR